MFKLGELSGCHLIDDVTWQFLDLKKKQKRFDFHWFKVLNMFDFYLVSL